MASVKESPPNSVWLDLMQNMSDQYEIISNVEDWLPRPRYISDSLPSVHCVLDSATPQQRSIGSGSVVKDTVRCRLLYYSSDYREIWDMYQTIKEIIVGNNQVSSTDQFDTTGIEWSMLGEVDFDVVPIDTEVILHYLEVVIESTYQDDY